MFCTNCGAHVADGARFCGRCGAPLGAPAPQVASGAAGVRHARRGGAAKVAVGIAVPVCAFLVMWVVGFLFGGGRVSDLPVVGGLLAAADGGGSGSSAARAGTFYDPAIYEGSPDEVCARLDGLGFELADSYVYTRSGDEADLYLYFMGHPDETPEGMDAGEGAGITLCLRVEDPGPGLDEDAENPVPTVDDIPDDAIVMGFSASYTLEGDVDDFGEMVRAQAETFGLPKVGSAVATSDEIRDQAVEALGISEDDCEVSDASYDALRVEGALGGENIDGLSMSWSASVVGEMDGTCSVLVSMDVA